MKGGHVPRKAGVSAWQAGIRAITLLILLLLTGCGPWRQPAIDRSILTDDPCAAPCWQGIVPGVTTSAEAADILMTLEFIRPDSLWSFGDGLRWRTSASREDPAIVSEIQSHDGLVSFTSIGVDFELTLQEIVEKYGPPEKLLAYESGRQEKIQIEIYFYYPQQGLVFVSWASDHVPTSEFFMLDAATPITLVYYFAPKTIDEWFDEHFETARRLRFGEEYLQDWQGLGPIDVID